MWVDKRTIEDLRADKARLLDQVEYERRARDREVTQLRNEIAILQGEANKMRLELDRLRKIASGSTAKAYGLTPELAAQVDWQRMGRNPPEE